MKQKDKANRFMELRRIIVIFVLLIVPGLAHSQRKELVDLSVTCRGTVGNALAFQFKEAIRSSASYTLTPTDAVPLPTLLVDIVCVDVPSDTSDPRTAVSVIASTYKRNRNKGMDCSFITNRPFYHGVYVANGTIKESAIGMLADIDKARSKQR